MYFSETLFKKGGMPLRGRLCRFCSTRRCRTAGVNDAMTNANDSSAAGPASPTIAPTVVVILRCTLPPPLLRHLFAIGAAGYLPAAAATTPAESWIAAAAVASAAKADADMDTDPTYRAAQLSPCELEVVRLIGAGQSTRAIASVLHRSIKTIETYRSRIRAKLGLKNPTALAQWAWRFVHGAGAVAA